MMVGFSIPVSWAHQNVIPGTLFFKFVNRTRKKTPQAATSAPFEDVEKKKAPQAATSAPFEDVEKNKTPQAAASAPFEDV